MSKLILFLFIMIMFGAMYTTRAQTIDKSFTPFDSYGRIAWIEEQARLSQLDLYLRKEPKMVGCMIFYWESRKDRDVMRRRIRRSYDYLTKKRRLEKNRLVIIDGGKNEFAKVILQPAPNTAMENGMENGVKPCDFAKSRE